MRAPEPIRQDAIFGDAIQNAIGANDRRIDGAGEDEHSHDNHEGVKSETQVERSRKVHGQTADQVLIKVRTGPIGDDHYGENGNERSEQEAVNYDEKRGLFQVGELGMLYFAVDLREFPRRSWPGRN